MRIQADAEERIGFPAALFQEFEERLGHYAFPSTMASRAMRVYKPYSICRK